MKRLADPSRGEIDGATAGACLKCGAPLFWRIARAGNAYKVDSSRQYHNALCTGRHNGSMALQAPASDPAPFATLHHDGAIPTFPPIPPTGTLETLIAAAVAPYVKAPAPGLDEPRVQALIDAALASHTPKSADGATRITVSVQAVPNGAIVDVGRQHEAFPLLLEYVSARMNVYLVGGAGSGKSTAAHKAAEALGMAFGAMSVGPQTTQSQIFGYGDMQGRFVETEFYRRYRDGGVYLIDEIDAGNPGVLTALNQALANGRCAFHCGMVDRHPDFVCIAAANTYGRGSDREYVGRLQQDVALLDRFVTLDWNTDEGFERDLALETYKANGGTDSSVIEAWLAKVLTARRKASAHKVRHIVSQRASINGAVLLARGIAESKVAESVLWKGLDAQARGMLS